MKLVVLWLAVIVLALAAAGSCSISHRSGDFACETVLDCAAGRVCVDGFCVTGQTVDAGIDGKADGRVDAAIDAMLPIDAGPMCPPQCTSCELDAKTCKIDCALDPDVCAQKIVCPPGFSCDIDCSTDRSCRNGISCTNNSACTISCGGAQSCRDITCSAGTCTLDCIGASSCGNVNCGPGKCTIDCIGASSCNNTDCSRACACDMECGTLAQCTLTTCPLLQCEDGLGGCVTAPFDCDICQ